MVLSGTSCKNKGELYHGIHPRARYSSRQAKPTYLLAAEEKILAPNRLYIGVMALWEDLVLFISELSLYNSI
jgi:hypothetical protein